MAWFDDAIAQIEAEHGGTVEAEDVATLQQKDEADRAAYLQALAEKQDRREAPTGYRPYDSQTSDPAQQAANAAADVSSGGARPVGGGSYGGMVSSAGLPMEGYGAAPAPFGETYAPLARPSYLQGQYVPGQWGETFAPPIKPTALQTPYAAPPVPTGLQTPYALPTQAELEASPGYLASQDAMQRGMERSAAAKGSILSGGFVGRTLPRAMGEYAGTAYGNLVGQTLGARQQNVGEYNDTFGRSLATRGQQVGEYTGDVSQAFQQYQQRYGQFADAQGLQLGARNVNEAAFQGDQATSANAFKTRYGQYLDAAGLKRQAENDLWSRNRDLSDLSLRAAALARP